MNKTVKYQDSVRKVKTAARRALWTNFMLEHSSPYILDASLTFLKKVKGETFVSLHFGENGLAYSLEEYTPQEGEVIIIPRLDTSIMEYLGEYPLDIVARLLKPVYFCTRKEADYLRTLYRAKDSLLVEVENLPGHEALMPVDMALR